MNLETLRTQIDQIDRQIIQLLGQRFKLVDDIGQSKQSQGLEVRDTDRYERLLSKLRGLATEQNVPVELVEELYHQIHEAAIHRQQS